MPSASQKGRPDVVFLRWICLFLLGLSQAVGANDPPVGRSESSEADVLRLAIVNTYGEEASWDYFNRAIKTIQKAIAPTRLEVQMHDQDTFLAAAHRQEFDISLASSGLTSWMINHTGGLPVLTMNNVRVQDPNYTSAGTIITRADRTDINELKDLKRQTIAVMSRSSFAGWQLPVSEIMAANLNPKRLTTDVISTGAPMSKIVRLVESGQADVGFLANCVLEQMATKGQIDLQAFKIINDKSTAADRCRRSTDLYPGWVISFKPTVSSRQAKQMTMQLLSLPISESGQSWTVMTDHSRVNELFKRIDLPLVSVHDLAWLMQYYRDYVVGGLVVIAVVLGNIVLLIFLVRLRTRQVKQALHQKYLAQAQADAAEARLESLQKVSAFGMVSGMLGHELKQPLTVISNYSGSLRRRLRQGRLTNDVLDTALNEIENSGQMAAEIVDRVRSYLKPRSREYRDLDLSRLARTVVDRQSKHASADVIFSVTAPPEVWVQADPIDLELVILNLLKNAVVAVRDVDHPQVTIGLRQETHHVYLTVKDNGPRLSDEEFSRIGAVGYTTEVNGLGLGVNIVKTLLEAYAGSITYERMSDNENGIEVTVKLPRLQRMKE